jgi:hypothetical protein
MKVNILMKYLDILLAMYIAVSIAGESYGAA